MHTSGEKDTCQLLGPVSLFVQTLMGMTAVAVLLIKRNYEHPRRKMIVWSYDIGKQIIGSLGIHFLNLGISILKRRRKLLFSAGTSGDDDEDQCDWYFLNLLLDTTVGIPILWLCLYVIESVLKSLHIQNIESGNYFPSKTIRNRPRTPLFSAFLKQLHIFIIGLGVMKVCVFLILNYLEDWAYWFADLILGWSDSWPNLQVFLVMFVFPILLNCFQYFCVDNVIKLPTESLTLTNAENFETNTFLDDEIPGLSTGPTYINAEAPNKDNNISSYGSII
ncbi:YPL162C [Saccharomyces arboricola H-6]|uniref:YPL162C n=1 Tax=Saccharomyces arboricola (strain H-6 / AS 2.3317 / CBS 10644) TaxID=1160507 RepID=J8PGY8_SACAR|nr:YPL162C [Saccharomyces arboricola H-6]